MVVYVRCTQYSTSTVAYGCTSSLNPTAFIRKFRPKVGHKNDIKKFLSSKALLASPWRNVNSLTLDCTVPPHARGYVLSPITNFSNFNVHCIIYDLPVTSIVYSITRTSLLATYMYHSCSNYT